MKMKLNIPGWAKTTIKVFLGFVIMFVLLFSVLTLTGKDNNGVPKIFGVSPLSVLSNSMEGTFNKGDVIFIVDTDPYELEVGDIITYWMKEYNTSGELIEVPNTHKIVGIEYDTYGDPLYITQGTNLETNPTPDIGSVTPNKVIGIYNGSRIPLLGFFITFISSFVGFGIFVVLPILLLFVGETINLIKVVSANEKEKLIAAGALNVSLSKEEKTKLIEEERARIIAEIRKEEEEKRAQEVQEEK